MDLKPKSDIINENFEYLDTNKQDILNTITGFDNTKTQILKNINGVIQWIDE